MDRLQSSAYALQRTHDNQNVLGFLTQHHGCTIYGEQVAYVELTDKLHANLLAIDLEIHALEVTFDDLGPKVSHRTGGVGLNLCLTVLYHHSSVLVVGIGNGEGVLVESVEESLLGIAVVLEGTMIIQMVASQVGKQATLKPQSADTLLSDGVTRALHKGIFTSCLHHLSQQSVQLYGVGCGMIGRNGLALNIVAYGREQTALMTELAEHII